MRYMYDQTRGPVMSVGSDNNYRAKMVVRFYARYLPPGARIRYVDAADARTPETLPQWLIVHGEGPDEIPPETIDEGFGVRFRLKRSFPQYGPSGWTWHVYGLVGS